MLVLAKGSMIMTDAVQLGGRGPYWGSGFHCEDAENLATGSLDTHPSPGLGSSAGAVFTGVQAV